MPLSEMRMRLKGGWGVVGTPTRKDPAVRQPAGYLTRCYLCCLQFLGSLCPCHLNALAPQRAIWIAHFAFRTRFGLYLRKYTLDTQDIRPKLKQSRRWVRVKRETTYDQIMNVALCCPSAAGLARFHFHLDLNNQINRFRVFRQRAFSFKETD